MIYHGRARERKNLKKISVFLLSNTTRKPNLIKNSLKIVAVVPERK